MTTESQKAFEEWFNPRKISDNAFPLESSLARTYAFAGWQASEARIRAMLESDEMVKKVSATLTEMVGDIDATDEEHAYFINSLAKAALKAIVEKLCK